MPYDCFRSWPTIHQFGHRHWKTVTDYGAHSLSVIKGCSDVTICSCWQPVNSAICLSIWRHDLQFHTLLKEQLIILSITWISFKRYELDKSIPHFHLHIQSDLCKVEQEYVEIQEQKTMNTTKQPLPFLEHSLLQRWKWIYKRQNSKTYPWHATKTQKNGEY